MAEFRKEQINFDDDIIINGSLRTDNLKQDGNTASSANTNGDYNIVPDGTGRTAIGSSSPSSTFKGLVTSGTVDLSGDDGGMTHFISTDNTYPVRQFVNLGHDTMFDSYDAYISPLSHKSSDVGSNYSFQKSGDLFRINKDSGIAPGSDLSWDTIWEANTSGEIVKPFQPFFHAYRDATVNNVTGNGTVYTVVYNIETVDTGNHYDNATGIYTAPVDGNYIFTASVRLEGILVEHERFYMRLTTDNDDYFSGEINPFNTQQVQGTDALTFSLSKYVYLDAADTAKIDILVDGAAGTLIVDLFGGNSVYTHFSGGLIC